MSSYRGRGNYRGNRGGGARYFQHEFPSSSNNNNNNNNNRNNQSQYMTPRGQPNSNRYAWRSDPRPDPSSQNSSRPPLLPTPPSVKNDNSFYCHQPPSFVQPIIQPQVTPELDEYEPIRPGPNATKKHSAALSPTRRLRQTAAGTSSSADRQTVGASVGESSHQVEVAKRKAFDAKRFKGHSESEGDNNNQHIVFSDNEDKTVAEQGSQAKSCDEQKIGVANFRNMEEAAEKTRQHLVVVDNELADVELNISRLEEKRKLLINQRASLTDILSSMIVAPTVSESTKTSSRAQTPQSSSSTARLPSMISPKAYDIASSSKRPPSNTTQTPRPELQCPEVSTHSQPQLPVSPVGERDRKVSLPQKVATVNQASNDNQSSSSAPRVAQKRKQSAGNIMTPDTSQQNSNNSIQSARSSSPQEVASSSNLRSLGNTLANTPPLVFRDVNSGLSSRGIDDDSLIVTCFVCVVNDPDLLLIGNKSGHVCKYSIQNQDVVRKEYLFKKPVTALTGVLLPEGVDLRIFAGSSDGDYRCLNGTMSDVLYQNRFGWGVSCIKYLLNHIYVGIGNGLISVVCPKRGVILERFSSGSCFIYDIEALHESARDTIVCSLKSSDNLSVRDASDGLHLRSIELPRLSFFNEVGSSTTAAALKQVNSATSPLACTHLACAGGFIFGCQANGQLLAVAPGDRKATGVANLDSRPITLSVIGFNSSNGIFVAAVTADAIVRVFLVSSSTPIGPPSSKKKRTITSGTRSNRASSRISSSSDDEQTTDANKTPITFQQVFHASMAQPNWSLRLAAITSSGLMCLVSYQTNANSNGVPTPPWVLEVYAFPKMLMGELS